MSGRSLFQDTSVLFDRIVERFETGRAEGIAEILTGRTLFGCTYSRLELKRSLIQNLVLELRYVSETGSFFTALERCNRLRQRRASTLISIWLWVVKDLDRQVEVSVGDSLDRALALQAESHIRNAVRYLWHSFNSLAVHFTDKTKCTRATEAPRVLENGSIDASIPESRCRQRQCENANFFRAQRSSIVRLVAELRKHEATGQRPLLTDEIRKALIVMERALRGADILFDYNTCVGVGDVWIHLESFAAGIKDFATRNRKDSEHICPPLGLNMMVPVESPKGE